jgi:hypothetical protein
VLFGAIVWAAPGPDPVGTLEVVSEPAGGQIIVNGRPAGRTPATLENVPIGDIRVEVRLEGYEPAEAAVRLKAGQVRRVKLTLRRLKGVGSIAVAVEPEGSDVFLGYAARGKTPCVIQNVPAGTHTVRVTREGFVPFETEITVRAGAETAVPGRLAPLGDLPDGDTPLLPPDLTASGTVNEDEEKALKPVRDLIEGRAYAQALGRLLKMNADEAFAAYRARIARDLALIPAMQRVLDAAAAALAEKRGTDLELELRSGIRLRGHLIEVAGGRLRLQLGATEKALALADLSTTEIAHLAASRLDRTDPDTHAALAVFYAAEGEFRRAERSILLAAGGRRPPRLGLARLQNFLAAQKAWAQQLEAEREKAEETKPEPEPPEETEKPEPPPARVILVDYARSYGVPEAAVEALARYGITVQVQRRVEYATDLEKVHVLYIHERDARERPLSKADVTAIGRFVQNGGALVYMGTFRGPVRVSGETSEPRDGDDPPDTWAILLKALGVELQRDYYRWGPRGDGAREMPREFVPATESDKRHPVNRGVHEVWFAAPVSTLRAARRFSIVQRLAWFGDAGPRPAARPAVAAAAEIGKGRLLVLSGGLYLGTVTNEQGREFRNDAKRFYFNALVWAAQPVRPPAR